MCGQVKVAEQTQKMHSAYITTLMADSSPVLQKTQVIVNQKLSQIREEVTKLVQNGQQTALENWKALDAKINLNQENLQKQLHAHSESKVSKKQRKPTKVKEVSQTELRQNSSLVQQ